ncbi:MAG: hypothetical protein HQ512_01695 [Rhodospirillales bacterium]|nr:hypothetical protein [Rhodospirillales bacterium]
MIRPTMVLIILLVASLGVTLFAVKSQVQDLEGELIGFNRSITDERQSIHVLKAEWSHLNEPTRLKNLAKRYLDMNAIESNQVGTADEMLPGKADEDKPASRVTPLATNISIERPVQ